jgi:hypothetical protein
MRSNRPGHSKQVFSLFCFPCCIAALVQGELAYVHGGPLCCSGFGLVVCAICLSMVLSRMCGAVALA